MPPEREFTVVDLFGGAGGTGLGFQQAGFKILAAVDIDPHASRTYEANLGVTVTRRDVSTLSPRWLRESLKLQPGALDVLAGCPPCQGFTRLRNDQGADDPRNVLALRYLQFVKEFHPRFAVFENVSGMLDSAHGKTMHGLLISGLKRQGYRVKQEVLEAADFGVPQFRRRVIIIAARPTFRVTFPAPTHGDPASDAVRRKEQLPWVTVREAIGAFPRLGAGASNERHGALPNHRTASTGERVCEFIRLLPRNGGSRSAVPRALQLPCHREHTGHADTYSRMAWDAPANTITTGCTNPSKGRFVHPTQTRALSFREAATLQSFPLTYRFHGAAIDRQIGNAVPPLLALALARALADALSRRRRVVSHGNVPDADVASEAAGATSDDTVSVRCDVGTTHERRAFPSHAGRRQVRPARATRKARAVAV